MNTVSEIRLAKEQTEYLKDQLRSGKVYVQGSQKPAPPHSSSDRQRLIAGWEKIHGTKWPTCTDKNGQKVEAQMHHIIPRINGGQNVAQNVHPIFQEDHQSTVHQGFLKVLQEYNNPTKVSVLANVRLGPC